MSNFIGRFGVKEKDRPSCFIDILINISFDMCRVRFYYVLQTGYRFITVFLGGNDVKSNFPFWFWSIPDILSWFHFFDGYVLVKLRQILHLFYFALLFCAFSVQMCHCHLMEAKPEKHKLVDAFCLPSFLRVVFCSKLLHIILDIYTFYKKVLCYDVWNVNFSFPAFICQIKLVALYVVFLSAFP